MKYNDENLNESTCPNCDRNWYYPVVFRGEYGETLGEWQCKVCGYHNGLELLSDVWVENGEREKDDA